MSRRGCSRWMALEEAVEVSPPKRACAPSPAAPSGDEAPVEDRLADGVRALVAAVRRRLARREQIALWPGLCRRSLRARIVARGRRLPRLGRRQQRGQPADRLREQLDPALIAHERAQGDTHLSPARAARAHGGAVDRELDDLVAAQAEVAPRMVRYLLAARAAAGAARAHASLPKEEAPGGSGAGSGSPRAARRTTRRLRRRRRGRGVVRRAGARRTRSRRRRTVTVATAPARSSADKACVSPFFITTTSRCRVTRTSRGPRARSPADVTSPQDRRRARCDNTQVSHEWMPHADHGRSTLDGIRASRIVMTETTLARLLVQPQARDANLGESSWGGFRSNQGRRDGATRGGMEPPQGRGAIDGAKKNLRGARTTHQRQARGRRSAPSPQPHPVAHRRHSLHAVAMAPRSARRRNGSR